MEHLASTVVHALAFIGLSGERTIDPDDAVRALEMLSGTLRGCTPDELAALRHAAAVAGEAERASGGSPRVLAFYRDLIENLHIVAPES